MPSPILPLSGEGSGILFGSTLIRFQTTFASRSEPRFSSTKIVKAGRKRELVPGFPRRIRSSSKIAKDRGNRAGFDAKIAEPPPILSKDNGRRAMNRTLFRVFHLFAGQSRLGPFALVRSPVVRACADRTLFSAKAANLGPAGRSFGDGRFPGMALSVCRATVVVSDFGRDRRNFGNRA